jgi:hypothetical protein
MAWWYIHLPAFKDFGDINGSIETLRKSQHSVRRRSHNALLCPGWRKLLDVDVDNSVSTDVLIVAFVRNHDATLRMYGGAGCMISIFQLTNDLINFSAMWLGRDRVPTYYLVRPEKRSAVGHAKKIGMSETRDPSRLASRRLPSIHHIRRRSLYLAAR